MDIERRIELVLRPPTEEVVTGNELRELLESTTHPRHYIGFEISGLMHLGSLFISGYKVRDLLEAGFECTVFLADWHSVLNGKLGGDWDRIRKGAKYFEEAFRFFAGDSKRLSFVLGSDLYHNNDNYWMSVARIAKATTVSRATRCLTIMGRKESEALDVAQYLYPPMQAADILELKVDLAHAGTDQRKIHMLLRDISDKIGAKKPVSLHHHLLPGLLEPVPLGLDENPAMDLKISSKMSKSKPENCIFIHDSAAEIKKKISGAFCPKTVENNPVLEIAKYIIFREQEALEIDRPAKFGGSITFSSYAELESAYSQGLLHPADLKSAVASGLDPMVKPVRGHFEKHKSLLEVFR